MRTVTVAQGRRTLLEAGLVRLKPTLDRRGKQLLRQRGRLPIVIKLRFKPRHGNPITTRLYATLVRRRHP